MAPIRRVPTSPHAPRDGLQRTKGRRQLPEWVGLPIPRAQFSVTGSSPSCSRFPWKRDWLGSRPLNGQWPKITCSRRNRGRNGQASLPGPSPLWMTVPGESTSGSLTLDGTARVSRRLLFLFRDIRAPDWLQQKTEPKCCGRDGICRKRKQAQ